MDASAAPRRNRLFLTWMQLAVQMLEQARAEIDALNVFPVPDGDTGTNMSLTFSAALREVERRGPDARLEDLVTAASQGALMGARGNSGVILSQFMRGLARVLASPRHPGEKGPAMLARALQEAADTAYRAVIKPVEGTMLSVGRAAARSAERLVHRRPAARIPEVLEAALEGARAALAQTPRQLPALAQAGVVDAGGRGLVVLLEAAVRAARGEVELEPAAVPAGAASRDGHVVSVAEMPGHGGISETDVTFRYCTEFLVRGRSIPQELLRQALQDLGDSLLVVGDPDLVKVHVHTNHPGQALEIGLRWGELLAISINNMQEQNRQAARKATSQGARQRAPHATSAQARRGGTVEPLRVRASGGRSTAVVAPSGNSHPSPAAAPAVVTPPASLLTATRAPATEREVGVVAVVSGEGLARIFRSLGVDEIVDGGQTMNPSIEELMESVRRTAARSVVLLPNNKNVLMTARQVAEISEKPVRVVPSRTMPEGLAAALAFRENESLDANAQQMEKACAGVASGEVTYAIRDSRFGDRDIHAGDIVGLAGGELVSVGRDVAAVTREVAQHLLSDGRSLLTLYWGHGVTREEAESLAEALRATFPGIELEVYYGGQPLFFYLLSAE
ncbi:MAG TPA: DAK2 domain-containing protein [Limnochordales bacterium]